MGGIGLSAGKGADEAEIMDKTTRRISAVTVEEMREVDRMAIEEFGVELIQMMENAGRHLASLARKVLRSSQGKNASMLIAA